MPRPVPVTGFLPKSIVRRTARTEPIRAVLKVRLKDRLQNHITGSPFAPPGPATVGMPKGLSFPALALGIHARVVPPGRPIALGLQRLLDLVQKPGHQSLIAFSGLLDLFDRLAIYTRPHSCCERPDRVPGRLQRVPPIDPVIQRVEPELRLLLRPSGPASVSAEKVSRAPATRIPIRLLGGTASMAPRSSVVGISFQAAFSSCYRSTSRLRPLRSTVITRFPATMGLSDSRPVPALRVMDPPQGVGGLSRHPAGPPRFLDGSVRARHPQAPRRSPTTAPTHCFIAGGRLHPTTREG